MYVFAEPVTEDEAEAIQNRGEKDQREFARSVVGLERDSTDGQSAWQELQSNVDREVDQGETATEQQAENTKAVEEFSENEELSENKNEGPLIGWTLTVRSKVNGDYVDRPENLQDQDSWELEYHIKEIGNNMLWKSYNAIKERRSKLAPNQGTTESLEHYRDLIKRYTKRGRAWRAKQDQLLEEQGVKMYKPLGPGSDAGRDE
jgi:hypothetical protein